MNMKQWMENPMGKGASVLQLPVLQEKFDAQYADIKSKIKVKWYCINQKYYVAHVLIPSLSIDRLFYDVLLEFDIDTIPKNSIVINDGAMRVFSNCPSFTFTYAHVYLEQGDLINWVKHKYSKKVRKLDPTQRNPQKVYSYERSLYFAIKYITSEGRNYKGKITNGMIMLENPKTIANLIRTPEEILELYDMGKKRLPEKDKKPEEDGKKSPQQPKKKSNKKDSIKKTKTVGKVGKTEKIKKIKKIK